jgi:hypothetical protein
MRSPMRCKRCGKRDNQNCDISVRQNTFSQFPKGQYVFLCNDCYKLLKNNPMLYESYNESGTYEQFIDRLNQEVR